ncbi:hypothetical protein K470DRAFT_258389 [Piedraia hortae CBS 480.64]|uniref:Major facilitator superfamily (MFS) profile domain-containing protein n=1 Tax=Piedraia hortae CBS 480.64 TaxID=1314780 RepID=A0A6A7BXC6_9PEZI|nr:hypothetical protein K470DRAFT_258389 [Piedraia hortae CBS 480.64]
MKPPRTTRLLTIFAIISASLDELPAIVLYVEEVERVSRGAILGAMSSCSCCTTNWLLYHAL